MNNTDSFSASLETKVSLMAKIGACWSPSFSPDGKQIAFISNLNGRPQVWTVPTAGGWPRQVTALEDQIVQAEWSPAGDWLAFNLAPGGGMNRQIYIVRPDGSEMRLLTDGGQTNNWLSFWTHDGGEIAIASNRRAPQALDTFLLNPTTKEHRIISEYQGIAMPVGSSQDNRFYVINQMVYRGNTTLMLMDSLTGKETELTPHDGPGNFGGARFSPDGRTIYLNGDYERELSALFRLTLDTDNTPSELELVAARDDAGLSDFQLTEDGKMLALIWNVAGRNELELMDTTTLSITASPTLPTEIIMGSVFSSAGDKLALTLTGAAAPRDIWVYDLVSGEFQQVTFSQHVGVNLSEVIKPELVRFTAHDGLELSGWLYLPREFQGEGSVVLCFHGGPEGQEVPNFNSTYQALLAEGIAVFAPNVRGSSGFGKTFVNLDNGALRVNAVRDIQACVNILIERGITTPGRIGIMGGSYGGYMTMAGITEYPDLFAAAANLYGIVNFRTFFEHTEPWMAAISKVEYGDPDTEADMLDSLSPIFKLDRVKAATLVLHGANDTNVPVIEAEQVVDHLRKHGVEVDYVLFEDEGHGFMKEPNRIRAAVAIVGWFKRFLHPTPPEAQ